MKSRIDSIIASCIIAGVVALGLAGTYALTTNPTSTVPRADAPPMAVYNGGPASPEASPEPTATASPEPTIEIVETEEPIPTAIPIDTLPGTGAGPSQPILKEGTHTGWHSTGVHTCDWLGRDMVLHQWFQYVGGTHFAPYAQYVWIYTGRWC